MRYLCGRNSVSIEHKTEFRQKSATIKVEWIEKEKQSDFPENLCRAIRINQWIYI